MIRGELLRIKPCGALRKGASSTNLFNHKSPVASKKPFYLMFCCALCNLCCTQLCQKRKIGVNKSYSKVVRKPSGRTEKILAFPTHVLSQAGMASHWPSTLLNLAVSTWCAWGLLPSCWKGLPLPLHRQSSTSEQRGRFPYLPPSCTEKCLPE